MVQSTNYKRADFIKVSPLLNAAGTRNVEKEFPASPSWANQKEKDRIQASQFDGISAKRYCGSSHTSTTGKTRERRTAAVFQKKEK